MAARLTNPANYRQTTPAKGFESSYDSVANYNMGHATLLQRCVA